MLVSTTPESENKRGIQLEREEMDGDRQFMSVQTSLLFSGLGAKRHVDYKVALQSSTKNDCSEVGNEDHTSLRPRIKRDSDT